MTQREEQYEKFKKFSDEWVDGFEDADLRIMFKDLVKTGILADPKDKLIALDEAIRLCYFTSLGMLSKNELIEIRAKFTGEAIK